MQPKRIACATLLAGIVWFTCAVMAGAAPREVDVAYKPDRPWTNYPTRIVADLPAEARSRTDQALSSYGGWMAHQTKASGFFRTEKVGDRWWLVDPSGYLFLEKGVVSVKALDTAGANAAFSARFGSMTNWANQTVDLLRTNAFNAVAGWSDTETLRKVQSPLVYNRLWNFMGEYGRKRGGTYQQPGHLGYPGDCIFVFDPEFETFCDEYAKQLAATKDDPWLLGHYSDNELPFQAGALKKYLALPEGDPGRAAAEKFVIERHGALVKPWKLPPEDQKDFLGVVASRYFSIVSRAIKKHDPNHLYLGCRFHGSDLGLPELFKAAGPYADVITVNWYHAWSPDAAKLAMWEHESGRPVMITEWYAKGMDSGMGNTGGAGWVVKTQRDRGWFYENFTLGLLESKVCVGWDWFRYIDNDPDDTKADPSNRDANKGIVSNRYVTYEPLLDAMKEVNTRAYSLADYFDHAGNASDRANAGASEAQEKVK